MLVLYNFRNNRGHIVQEAVNTGVFLFLLIFLILFLFFPRLHPAVLALIFYREKGVAILSLVNAPSRVVSRAFSAMFVCMCYRFHPAKSKEKLQTLLLLNLWVRG